MARGQQNGGRRMKAIEAYHEAERLGAGFLANIIKTHHRNPAKKIKGLVMLLKNGHQVRTGQFEIDVLVVDGVRMGWDILESHNTFCSRGV